MIRVDNPYAPTDIPKIDNIDKNPFPKLWWVVVIILGALVIANQWTATSSTWSFNPFMTWIFLTLPVSVATHLWLCGSSPNRRLQLLAIFVAVTIACSFVYFCGAALLSRNPNEYFVMHNNLFGPYGWIQWLLLVTTAALPLLYLSPDLRDSRATRFLLALVIVSACAADAFLVIRLSHM